MQPSGRVHERNEHFRQSSKMILNDREVTKRGKFIKREGKEEKYVKECLKKKESFNDVQDCSYKAYFCS